MCARVCLCLLWTEWHASCNTSWQDWALVRKSDIIQTQQFEMTTSASIGRPCRASAEKYQLHGSCQQARCSDCQIKGKSKQCMVGCSKCQWGPAWVLRFLLSGNTSCWGENGGARGGETSIQKDGCRRWKRLGWCCVLFITCMNQIWWQCLPWASI